MTGSRALLGGLFCAFVAACGGDEGLGSRGEAGPVGDAGGDASVPDAAPVPDGPLPDAPVPKRTVSRRNPFGNVAAVNNMLWDGDFEWVSSFSQQYGWTFANLLVGSFSFDQVRVGSVCRSGMKCGYLTQNQRVAAIGVSPSDAMVSASLWATVPTGFCYDVAARLFACDYEGDPDVNLVAEGDVPDASGWCHFTVVTAPRERATCLFVEARFQEGEALIDDAVVQPVPDGARVAPSSSPPVTSDEARALDEARAAVREYLKPGQRPKSEARVAFERWLGRRR